MCGCYLDWDEGVVSTEEDMMSNEILGRAMGMGAQHMLGGDGWMFVRIRQETGKIHACEERRALWSLSLKLPPQARVGLDKAR